MLKIGTFMEARPSMETLTQTLTIGIGLEARRKIQNYIFNNFSARSVRVKSPSISDIFYEENSHDTTMIIMLQSNIQCMFMAEE